MEKFNQGECKFVLTDLGQLRKFRPSLECKCGKVATRILEDGRPLPCLAPAARAVLSGDFESLMKEWRSAHPRPRERALTPPTGAAPVSVHRAWAKEGGVTLAQYRKNQLLGRQPAAASAFDPFEKAREIVAAASPSAESHAQATEVPVTGPPSVSAEDIVGSPK